MLWAVLISVNFCSSVADRWPGSYWKFWSNPFFIVPNAPITTGTIFVLALHILLTAIYRSSTCYVSSVSVVLKKFESSPMAISRQVFSFYQAVPYRVGLLVCPICDNRYVTHNSDTIEIYGIFKYMFIVGKDKVHPCTGTEALCRPYGPQGE